MHTKSVNGTVMLCRMQSFVVLMDSRLCMYCLHVATDGASLTDEGGS